VLHGEIIRNETQLSSGLSKISPVCKGSIIQVRYRYFLGKDLIRLGKSGFSRLFPLKKTNLSYSGYNNLQLP
jgi:hypothetical protein